MSEREAIKSLKEFAYTTHGTLSAEEAKIVLNLIEKLQKENEDITRQRDYYKARYNEFNNYFLKNNMTI